MTIPVIYDYDAIRARLRELEGQEEVSKAESKYEFDDDFLIMISMKNFKIKDSNWKNASINSIFPWRLTHQGHSFWEVLHSKHIYVRNIPSVCKEAWDYLHALRAAVKEKGYLKDA